MKSKWWQLWDLIRGVTLFIVFFTVVGATPAIIAGYATGGNSAVVEGASVLGILIAVTLSVPVGSYLGLTY